MVGWCPVTTHPAGRHSVADILTQRLRSRTAGWAEETDETTWRAEDHDAGDHCRWVIVATGQLAPRDAIGDRPGPLVVAGVNDLETRIQLPWVVDNWTIDSVVGALIALGVVPTLAEVNG